MFYLSMQVPFLISFPSIPLLILVYKIIDWQWLNDDGII